RANARQHEKPTTVRFSLVHRNLAIAFEHYNEKHPHSALKYRSPREFRRSMDSATLV
ncbi:integrase core domain-containing protein, partial [Burkholderia cenocepacia]|uniref:integrase core domain-containing protein n=1 Tax=Burkholderia cenocepacia TaxID=95486 RepID=UPI0012931A81